MKSNKVSKIVTIILLAAIVVATVLVFAIPPLITEKYDKTLTIYNWADYMDLSILDEFAEYYEETTGDSIKVVYSNFDTNETMLTEIIKGDSKIDLMCPSEYAIQKLLVNNSIQKLDWSHLPDDVENYSGNINAEIRDKIDGVFSNIAVGDTEVNMNDYFIPYMWGTLGILYNTNYVTAEQVAEAGYGILWNKTGIEELNGKILVKDSIRDIYVAAVMYLYEENLLPEQCKGMTVEELINSTDSDLVKAVEKVLQEEREVIKGYEVDFGKDDMVNEIAYVDLAWSGDAMYAIEEATDDEGNSFLDYYVPESGGNIWFDGWVIPKENDDYTPNYKEAYMFLNYLCRPDIAMRNVIEIGYAGAEDPAIYTPLLEDETYMDLLLTPETFELGEDGELDLTWNKTWERLDDEFAEDDNYYALSGLISLLECYEIVDSETGEKDADEITEFIGEGFFDDERRYAVISNPSLGMMRDFGDKNEGIVEMWESVKSSSESDNWVILGIIIGVLGLAAAGVIILLAVKYRKQPKPRKAE